MKKDLNLEHMHLLLREFGNLTYILSRTQIHTNTHTHAHIHIYMKWSNYSTDHKTVIIFK